MSAPTISSCGQTRSAAYEALLRVFNDPAPYARRLAKRLHAQPHRLPELLRAPPDAAAKIGDAFAELRDMIEANKAAFDTT